jgi:hypothetical protein
MATADSMARAAAAKAAAKKAAAKKKGTTQAKVTMSADRLSTLKRTQTRAGKGVGNVAQRAKQNAGVKDGTIRRGAKGKSFNVFDAKTQTWKRGTATGASKPKPTTTKKPTTVYGGIRKPTPGIIGPGVVGIKRPKDGGLYRFGGPGNMETFKWDAKSKKFIKAK